ncbi:MAG: hypothetical protein U0575_13765 [Phycisphaerales bacterium]
MSCTSRLFVPSSICSAVFAACLVAGADASTPVVATATYSVNGEAPTTVNITGTLTPSGNYSFVKTITVGQYKFTFNYAADVNPVNNALINGSSTVENNSSAPIDVTTSFTAPICPHLNGSSNIGGLCTIKLICNGDGGAILCSGDVDYLVSAIIDDVPAQNLFYCPFVMAKTGSGSTTTNTQWGTPIPSAVGPSYVGSLGHTTHFTMTPGDKAVFSLLFATNGTIDDPLADPCPGDVDGNGVVDKDDLMIVLSLFGQSVSCGTQADTDGNGLIDGSDVNAVISYWGECPG